MAGQWYPFHLSLILCLWPWPRYTVSQTPKALGPKGRSKGMSDLWRPWYSLYSARKEPSMLFRGLDFNTHDSQPVCLPLRILEVKVHTSGEGFHWEACSLGSQSLFLLEKCRGDFNWEYSIDRRHSLPFDVNISFGFVYCYNSYTSWIAPPVFLWDIKFSSNNALFSVCNFCWAQVI